MDSGVFFAVINSIKRPIILDRRVVLFRYLYSFAMNLNHQRAIPVFILTVFFSIAFFRTAVWAEFDIFPNYPSVQPNVDFWTKIYTEYSFGQGVIHDKLKLDRIYDVVELVDPGRHGSRKINRQRIKKAKEKYKTILRKLLGGEAPSGPEELRVAGLFGPDAKGADFRLAIGNLRCQIGQKDRFREGIIRSGAYIDEIRQIFREQGLPEELVCLAHVESCFNPKAYSKSGALGIWQFTRSTGRLYMKVGYSVDERLDPILSSHAAAKLLWKNYKEFRNWPMAITAYNHGTPGMMRAKRLQGSYESIFKNYRSRSFRFASRNFYSEFLAARHAAQNYRQYFGDLKMETPIKRREILLAGYVSLPELARHLKLDLAVLRNLNPALRHPVFSGQKYVPKGYRLRLPDRDEGDLQNLIARLPQKLYRHNQKKSDFYTVRRGDTAWRIASNHGVKLDDLIAANNLDTRATVHVNQNLKIPRPMQKAIQIAKRNPREADAKSTQIQTAENKTRSLPAGIDSSKIEIKSIAEYQQTNLLANRQDNDPAQPVDLWQFKKPVHIPHLNPETIQGYLAVRLVLTQRGKPFGTIRVEMEETLAHYADWLQVPARELRQLNKFRYDRPLQLNQQIKIPLHRVTKEEFEKKRFEFHKEVVEDFFASYRVEKLLTYFIKRGDNIWTLSREEFEVPVWLIKRYNTGVDFSALLPSQKLLIPVLERDV